MIRNWHNLFVIWGISGFFMFFSQIFVYWNPLATTNSTVSPSHLLKMAFGRLEKNQRQCICIYIYAAIDNIDNYINHVVSGNGWFFFFRSVWVYGLGSSKRLCPKPLGWKQWPSFAPWWPQTPGVVCSNTVDGRNPAPRGMYKTLVILGYLLHQVVQDFIHQLYGELRHTHMKSHFFKSSFL